MDGIAAELDREMPGALAEIAPSPDYDLAQPLTRRAMFLQAWSSLGSEWPIVHELFGVGPDAPRRAVAGRAPAPARLAARTPLGSRSERWRW
jgi:hypothetical protein